MTPFALSGILIVLTSLFLAGLIYRTARERQANRLWLYFNLTVAAWGFGATVAALTQLPGVSIIWWRLSFGAGLLLGAIYFHMSCVLCGTEQPRRLWILAVYVTHTAAIVLLLVGVSIKNVRLVFNSFYLNEPTAIFTCVTVVWAGTAALAHYDLIRHVKRLHESERVRLKLFVIGTTVGFIGGGSIFLPIYGVNIYPYGNFLIPIHSVVATYAVLRHHFMDIRIVISKGLVYSLLIAAITGIYLVMVLILERWFQGFIGYQSVIATLLVAFLIAIGFNPLRGVMQTFVDRMLFQGTPVELVAQRERLLTQVTQGEQMKAVATLAAGLAHEIKNPLSSIKTFARYLPERYEDPKFRENFSRIVQSEVDRIDELVKNLLDFAKPTPPDTSAVNLAKTLEDTLSLLEPQLMKQRITIHKAFKDNDLNVEADPKQLKQVILNLVLNSIESMENGGRLELTTWADRDALTLRVTDTGYGIPSSELHKVWDPFFTTKERGMGLGMAIVKGVVERHGGKIAISSTVGKGTTVELSLPLTHL